MLNLKNSKQLAETYRSGKPFRHIVFNQLVKAPEAKRVAESFPSFAAAEKIGQGFETVNEHRKIQITNFAQFPDPVKDLSNRLSSPEFIAELEEITGIKNLLWDDEFVGGGMHQTASSGVLDVHIDFNHLKERGLYRRLNLLVYLNPVWDQSWGGELELWDANVQKCHVNVVPNIGKAVLFETSEISFHGVTAVQCPEGVSRKSFAAYYYTKEAPEGYSGKAHSTVFKARPTEYLKKYLRMPAEALMKSMDKAVYDAKQVIKKQIGR